MQNQQNENPSESGKSPRLQRLVATKDGSNTLFNETYQQTYKSQHAAKLESEVVFWQKGILENPLVVGSKRVHVLELGFGTGLNLATLLENCQTNNIHLNYTGLDREFAAFYQCATTYSNELEPLLQQSQWQNANAVLTLHQGEFSTLLPSLCKEKSATFDCIYFDAFSPKENPDGWTKQIFQHCSALLRPQGRLVTYSVSKVVKENLRQVGLQWQKYKLPAQLCKREGLVAWKE